MRRIILIFSILFTLCGYGVAHAATCTSTGISISLYAEPYTEPSLVVKVSSGQCYGKLEEGQSFDTINFNGNIYHLVD